MLGVRVQERSNQLSEPSSSITPQSDTNAYPAVRASHASPNPSKLRVQWRLYALNEDVSAWHAGVSLRRILRKEQW